MKTTFGMLLVLLATGSTTLAANRLDDQQLARAWGGLGNGNGNGNLGSGNGNGNFGNNNGNGNLGDLNGNLNPGDNNGNNQAGSGIGNGIPLNLLVPNSASSQAQAGTANAATPSTIPTLPPSVSNLLQSLGH